MLEITTQDPTPLPERDPPVRLSLLGGFELTVAGQRWDMWGSCRRLLAYLALHERPQSRTVIAAALWPEKTEQRAAANLRASLWRLPKPSGVPLVESIGGAIQLKEPFDVDVKELETVGWAIVADPSTLDGDVDPTVFFRELLPGWYDDWVIFQKERIAQLHRRFLEALTYALVRRNRLPKALDVALRLVHADPLSESSQRALLTVYREEGNLGQAWRQYEGYRKLILETFGCEPSSSLRALVQGRPLRAADPLRSPAASR